MDDAVRRANRRVTYQWAAVIVVGIVLFGLVLVFGSGTGGNLPTGGGGLHGN